MVRASARRSRVGPGFGIQGGGLPVPDSFQNIVDHAIQAQALPILGSVDPFNPVGFEFRNLIRGDRPAPPDHDRDVLRAFSGQLIHKIFEILHVTTLVGAHRNRLCILRKGGLNELRNRAVVSEMHHFRALGKQETPDQVDCGIVTVEKRCGRHETDRFRRNRFRAGFQCSGTTYGQGSATGMDLMTFDYRLSVSFRRTRASYNTGSTEGP